MRTFCPSKIKNRRNQKKISQQRLAEMVGTSRIYILEIEKGKKIPRATMLTKLAQALKVRESYFFVNDVCNN